jgi:hypothetical protein
MMIDPITAFSAVSAASGAISSAIKAGKDLHSLSGPIKKYAAAEAALNFGAQRKKNSIFSKMTGAEQAGIDEFFRKQEVENLRSELRTIFMLHGKRGQWEALQAEIARQRQMQKDALEHQAKQRERLLAIITVLGLLVFGGGGIFYWVAWMKDWL